MHPDRDADPPAGVAGPGSPEFEHQRRVLLEVAIDPPPGGTAIATLAAAEQTVAQVDAAVAGGRAAVADRPLAGERPVP